jgi:hypothetical protein
MVIGPACASKKQAPGATVAGALFPFLLHLRSQRFPMRRSLTLCLLVPAALLVAACASGPAPRVSWLGDGVFKSPTVQEAEAYCRNFGAPMRFLDPKAAAGAPTGEVSYRCD